jgi:hypothetical protein
MEIDLYAKLTHCPLCHFDFVNPRNPTKKGGFGKETSLEESRKYVQQAYESMGYPLQMPAPQDCPACWFGVTAERAPILANLRCKISAFSPTNSSLRRELI